MQKIILILFFTLLSLIVINIAQSTLSISPEKDTDEFLVSKEKISDSQELFVSIEHIEYRDSFAYILAKHHDELIILRAPINPSSYHLLPNTTYQVLINPTYNSVLSCYELKRIVLAGTAYHLIKDITFPLHVLGSVNQKQNAQNTAIAKEVQFNILTNIHPIASQSLYSLYMPNNQVQFLHQDVIYHLIITSFMDVFLKMNGEIY